jgi:two-component system KDP operon response regulator KdpE
MKDAHHLVPKSKGGKQTQFLHRICHRQIHALFTETELARQYSTVEALLAHPEIELFVKWVKTKPFSVAELLARIRVAVRHSNQRSPPVALVYKNSDLIFDLDKKRLTRAGQVIKLSKTELKLLTLLATSPGYICTHRQLLKEVWGSEFVEHTHYLRIYMAQIRAKIEHNPADPQILLTETGIGYRLAEV